MKRQKYHEPTNGVLTDRMDTDTSEFNQFQAILLNRISQQTEPQKRKVELMALKFKMEDYLQSKEKNELKLAGEFLKSYLKILGIQQKKFADYVGVRPSNLSKLLKGERPISSEMALILGRIFNQDPMLWLEIQTKNELIKLSRTKSKELKKYSLEDLIEVNVG